MPLCSMAALRLTHRRCLAAARPCGRSPEIQLPIARRQHDANGPSGAGAGPPSLAAGRIPRPDLREAAPTSRRFFETATERDGMAVAAK